MNEQPSIKNVGGPLPVKKSSTDGTRGVSGFVGYMEISETTNR